MTSLQMKKIVIVKDCDGDSWIWYFFLNCSSTIENTFLAIKILSILALTQDARIQYWLDISTITLFEKVKKLNKHTLHLILKLLGNI